MSLDTHSPEASSSSSSSSSWLPNLLPSLQQSTDPTHKISLHVPTSLLVLPPTAGFIGMIIGMSRGGSRARLRFLAENAHRQPRTVQGWYFYTKTRNYRVFFAALRTGARYALALGAATSIYVIVDESIGYTRERIFHPELHLHPTSNPQNTTSEGTPIPWRKATEDGEEVGILPHRAGWRRGAVHWEDGAGAGALLGCAVGVMYRLPNPLLFRSIAIGTILGTLTSSLQIVQAHIGRIREDQVVVQKPHDKEMELLTSTGQAASDVEGTVDVDRPGLPEVTGTGLPIESLQISDAIGKESTDSRSSSWWSALGLGWGSSEDKKT